MEAHVLLMIFVSSSLNCLAVRKYTSSANGVIVALQGTNQSMEEKIGANRTRGHNVGRTIANRYILAQELENRRHGHGGPSAPKLEFIVIARLGEGGCATAYKATDMSEQKDVVLKILNEDTADSWSAQQQTFDECEAMQALQRDDLKLIFPDGAKKLMRCTHNNIKVGQKGLGNSQFIVLEYGGIQLDKEPKLGLDVFCAENRLKHIVEMVNQTLRGIVYLAGLGVSHRDLKPENILVKYDASGNAQVKIIDFGAMAHGKDVHCGGSTCKLQNTETDCTNTAVCDPPSVPSPSQRCSFKWDRYFYAPPEMRHDNQRVCLSSHYPVDAFDIWSMGMTVVQLVNAQFSEDHGIGDGFQGDAPSGWKKQFWADTSPDSSSGELLSDFCQSALQSHYSARGRVRKSNDQLRVVDLLKIFDVHFEKPNFPDL